MVEYWKDNPSTFHSMREIRQIARWYYDVKDVPQGKKSDEVMTKNDLIMAFAGMPGISIVNGN